MRDRSTERAFRSLAIGRRATSSGLASFVAALLLTSLPLAAQPFVQRIDPFVVERSDGGALLNPFSGGLAQPRIMLRDADRDGRPDLFTLNPDNRLRLYRNEGSFRFRRLFPSPFDNAPVRSWFRFADLDADGDDDLFTAGARSEVLYLRNDGTQLQPVYQLPADTVRGSDGVPITMQQETVPSLVDIDGDGDIDFFSGNLDGSITFYENTGTAQGAIFTFRTSRFEDILVISSGGRTRRDAQEESSAADISNRHGASVLDFVDLDGDGDLDFLFGDFFTRRLLYFPNSGSRTDPAFSMATLDTAFAGNGGDLVDSEGFNQPTSGDIDGDGDIDVVVSSLLPFSTVAPIILYENRGSVTAPQMRRSGVDMTAEIDIGSYAAPASIDDADRRGVLVGSTAGALTYFEERVESGKTIWRSAGRYPLPEFSPAFLQTAPATGDLNGDGRAEIVVGDAEGRVALLRFDGSRLVSIASELDTVKVNQNASPALFDLDRDGDLDLMIGTGGGRFIYLENRGSSTAFRFERSIPPAPFDTLDVGSDAAPRFHDLDRDGDADAVVGSRGGGTAPDLIRFYDNQGGVFISTPSWPDIVTIRNPVPLYRSLTEGRYLFAGNSLGGITAFLDQALSGVADEHHGSAGLELSMVNGRICVLRGESSVASELRIVDMLGRQVLQVDLPAGVREVRIDAGAVAAGVYVWKSGRSSGKIVW